MPHDTFRAFINNLNLSTHGKRIHLRLPAGVEKYAGVSDGALPLDVVRERLRGPGRVPGAVVRPAIRRAGVLRRPGAGEGGQRRPD